MTEALRKNSLELTALSSINLISSSVKKKWLLNNQIMKCTVHKSCLKSDEQC